MARRINEQRVTLRLSGPLLAELTDEAESVGRPLTTHIREVLVAHAAARTGVEMAHGRPA
jgi:predicted DNA binding CopG/RHH family protein